MGDDVQPESQYAQVTPRTEAMVKLLSELVRREVKAERERQAQIGEILDGAPLTPPVRRPKRDRHGLHIVRGALPLAAGVGTFARSHARKLIAGTATAAVLTGGALTPDMMAQAPASQLPFHHHHAAVHHRHTAVPAAVPLVPVRRRRRLLDDDDVVAAPARHVVVPSPHPSTVHPSPDPVPSPLPSIPVPSPDPSPTCTWLTGHHCHDGGDDVVGVLGTLLGQP